MKYFESATHSASTWILPRPDTYLGSNTWSEEVWLNLARFPLICNNHGGMCYDREASERFTMLSHIVAAATHILPPPSRDYTYQWFDVMASTLPLFFRNCVASNEYASLATSSRRKTYIGARAPRRAAQPAPAGYSPAASCEWSVHPIHGLQWAHGLPTFLWLTFLD